MPRLCVACGCRLPPSSEIICDDCKCQMLLANHDHIRYEYNRKFLDENIITDFTAAYIFQKETAIQNMLHELKYNKKFRIGFYLGKQIGELLGETILRWSADYVCPVPLHHLKKAERGYNQSYYIAKGLRDKLLLSVNNKIVKRTKFTETQTTMTSIERAANIKNAFQPRNKNMIKNARIILIDDVITTGATTSECARTLKKHGASKIYALSVCIAE